MRFPCGTQARLEVQPFASGPATAVAGRPPSRRTWGRELPASMCGSRTRPLRLWRVNGCTAIWPAARLNGAACAPCRGVPRVRTRDCLARRPGIRSEQFNEKVGVPVTIRYFDPRAEPSRAAEPYTLSLDIVS